MPARLILAGALIASLSVSALADRYSDAIQALDPVVYYRFNQGASWSVINSATGSNAATGSAAIRFNTMLGVASGPLPGAYPGFQEGNGAVKFDSSSPQANVVMVRDDPAKTNLQSKVTGASAVSVVMWINPSSLPAANNNMTLFTYFIENTASIFPGFSIVLNSDASGQTQLTLAGRSQPMDTTQSQAWDVSIRANEWFQIVGVFDFSQKEMELFVNGALVGSAVTGLSWAKESFNPASTVRDATIGAAQNIDAAGSKYNGLVDEFTLYNYALSQSQVATVYNAAIPEPSAAALLGIGGGFGLFCQVARLGYPKNRIKK